MNPIPLRSSLATAFALLLCGCVTTASGQQGPQAGRGEDIPLPPVAPPPTLGALAKPCNVVLAVKNSSDEHLKLGQWVQLIGPLAPGGHYLVRPVINPGPGTPPHRWVTGVYWATNVTVNVRRILDQLPDHQINVKGGPHPDDRARVYLNILSFDPWIVREDGAILGGRP
jgi:hypothetical protein